MSLALARKYRPRSFSDVAVQSHVSGTLRGAIASDRVAHGYLLCGPRGVGKTTLARVLAMALNCENRDADGEPCGRCASCQRIWSGSSSLDVVEIDAASNRGVDDARQLRERAMYAPSGEDRYKVYIVDEAHMLTREAWNALLKILEEPPPRVVFVFATTEPQKIAQTAAPVLSRLQRFDLRRIGAKDIVDRLSTVLTAESVEATPVALEMIARAADGSMRDALSLADQVISVGARTISEDAVRSALGLVPEDEYLAILDVIAERRAADVFATIRRLSDEGADYGLFLAGMADMLRAQLAVVLGGEASGVSAAARERLAANAGKLAPGDLIRMLSTIGEIEPQFRRSSQQELLTELLLVRFALLDRTVTIDELLRSVGISGPPSPRAAPHVTREEPRAKRGDSRAAPRSTGGEPLSRSAPPEPSPPASPEAPRAAASDLRSVPQARARDEARAARAPDPANAASDPGARITDEMVRAEKLSALRARDPVLDAAVDALDLELLD